MSFISNNSPQPPLTLHSGEMKWDSANSCLIFFFLHEAASNEKTSSLTFIWFANPLAVFKKKIKKVNESLESAWDELSRSGLTQ